MRAAERFPVCSLSFDPMVRWSAFKSLLLADRISPLVSESREKAAGRTYFTNNVWFIEYTSGTIVVSFSSMMCFARSPPWFTQCAKFCRSADESMLRINESTASLAELRIFSFVDPRFATREGTRVFSAAPVDSPRAGKMRVRTCSVCMFTLLLPSDNRCTKWSNMFTNCDSGMYGQLRTISSKAFKPLERSRQSLLVTWLSSTGSSSNSAIMDAVPWKRTSEPATPAFMFEPVRVRCGAFSPARRSRTRKSESARVPVAVLGRLTTASTRSVLSLSTPTPERVCARGCRDGGARPCWLTGFSFAGRSGSWPSRTARTWRALASLETRFMRRSKSPEADVIWCTRHRMRLPMVRVSTDPSSRYPITVLKRRSTKSRPDAPEKTRGPHICSPRSIWKPTLTLHAEFLCCAEPSSELKQRESVVFSTTHDSTRSASLDRKLASPPFLISAGTMYSSSVSSLFLKAQAISKSSWQALFAR
mmetsp:Transcript_13387/g.25705  ORF Transcript_13387/g.25705 Transcript_13387/m.25705 type:complete len:477 (-) Transcript_13387:2541-3971(-)